MRALACEKDKKPSGHQIAYKSQKQNDQETKKTKATKPATTMPRKQRPQNLPQTRRVKTRK
jgi:hypothetical protein